MEGWAGDGWRQRGRLPEGSFRAVTTPSPPPPAFSVGGAKARNNAMDFSRFFIDRPIFAAVLSIVIFAAGLLSIPLLPIGEYPDVVPPSVVVRTVYPGANPKVIAETVATPLEEAINGVAAMMRSEWRRVGKACVSTGRSRG